ncbi:DUF7455 domain-containing protein [Kitasatospora atroaurantiaca]|uniref:DUF7455 domain-containing protein n=1 Tax=Kitasatospora atroaurantiaca TaxID=285545 RepID=A0A561EJ30_9ACTN|nr:hypothetical protein FB465_0535 [Kitasatospora atroaurantiaca]
MCVGIARGLVTEVRCAQCGARAHLRAVPGNGDGPLFCPHDDIQHRSGMEKSSRHGQDESGLIRDPR